MLGFQHEKCGGNLIEQVSKEKQIIKCDKCGWEISLHDLEEELDSNPATMGELWFCKW